MKFIVEDAQLLRAICGPHDSYLTEVESVTQGVVYTQGNTFTYQGSEELLFSALMKELVLSVKKEKEITPSLIREIARALQEDESAEKLRSLCFDVPGGASVFPKNVRQYQYMQSIQQHQLIFGIGPAGTGKTYIAIAAALEEVLQRKKKKIVLTRPVVEAGESLGFLPGDLSQKISPYLRPLYDAMEAIVPLDIIQRMEKNRLIEVAPLAYMRGRSIHDAVIILDEAQNTTLKQMKMFLTRLSHNSKTIITGDITQIDLKSSIPSGLIHAQRVLSEIPEIAMHTFQDADVVRSRLVKKIVRAYGQEA